MERETYQGAWSGPGYSADPFHRLYIRYREKRVACLSSFGKGIIEEDGLDLFEWLREGLNIERLKKGLLQIYSSEDASSHVRPMQYVDLGAEATTQKKQSGLRSDATQPPASLLAQFSQAWASEKLEWIASPQADLQDRLPLLSLESPHLHGPRWCYLLDLDTDTLDVYEPRRAQVPRPGSPRREPDSSLIMGDTPAYYCKIHLSELQAMWRKDWVTRHRTHAEALARLWSESAVKCCPQSSMSFKRLYDVTFDDKPANGGHRRYPRRSTRAKMGEVVTEKKNAQPLSCGSRKAAHTSTFIHDTGVQGSAIAKSSNSRRSSRLADLSRRARRAPCRGAGRSYEA